MLPQRQISRALAYNENLQGLGKVPGTLRWEGGVQGCNAMEVKVIHYQNDRLSRAAFPLPGRAFLLSGHQSVR